MGKAARNNGLWLAVSRTILLLVGVGLLYLLFVTTVPVLVWIVITVAGAVMVLTVTRHARLTTYQCRACGQSFAVSAWVDFISPICRDPNCCGAPNAARWDGAKLRQPGHQNVTCRLSVGVPL